MDPEGSKTPQHYFEGYLYFLISSLYKLREAIRNDNEYYSIQYKRALLFLHEGPSLVYWFAYILYSYEYYILLFLVLVGKIASFAKTSCASTLANSHADNLTGLTGLSGASCAAFLKAYFMLVGK